MSDSTPPNRYDPFPPDPPGIVRQLDETNEAGHGYYPEEEQRERLRQQLGRDLTAEELQRIEQTNQRW